MSTLVTKKKIESKVMPKAVVVYLICTVLAIIVNYVYGLFGHGIKSASMTYMFLYPLLGGAVFFMILGVLLPKVKLIYGFRVFFNLYNSGIATLTVGGFVTGVLEVAGTNSPYLKWYASIGWGLTGISFVVLIIFGFMVTIKGKQHI